MPAVGVLDAGVDGVGIEEVGEEVGEGVEVVGDALVGVLEVAVLEDPPTSPATTPSHLCPIPQQPITPLESRVQSVPAYCSSSLALVFEE